jgi:hypothetical protein
MGVGEPSEDPSKHLADLHFETERTRLLGAILHKARFGQLAADWRSVLTAPDRPGGTATLYTDGDRLAVEAIRMMDPAKWEPGNTSGWRAALQSWYVDSLAVVDDSANAMTRSTSLMRARAKRTRKAVGDRPELAGETKQPSPSPGYAKLDKTLDSMDNSIDGVIRTYELIRRRARDRIKAEYRAGLAAGGDQPEVDWLEWLANEIRTWPNDEAIKSGLAEISKPNFREQLEYLPSYWL